ncbi:AAA family ATPase [uncultured Shewanella sp.]|uniref:AAA family ATPase n=1 Tax=uncultured Shewanella sp. TaxID=173975 RepID=UPI00260BBC91|nr:AAA family ATPase [uncultured Shewanella sp.]
MLISDIEKIGKIANETRMLRSEIQQEFRDENQLKKFSRNSFLEILGHANKVMSETKLDGIMKAMETEGYTFNRRSNGKTSPYDLTLENLYDIAENLDIKKHRNKKLPAFVAIMQNLKGGVGKSLATNKVATAAIMLNNYLLKQLRVLIVDLDPQATTTESNIPNIVINDGDLTSIQAMADEDLSRQDLLKYCVKKTSISNLSVIPCGTFDGFITEELNTPEIYNQTKPFALLKNRITDKLKYDFDIILLDAGPHMDIVMKNAIAAANGIFIPVPPTYYNYDSTMRFIEKLPETIKEMLNQGYDLNNLKFINTFITKDPTHINSKRRHNNMVVNSVKDDLKNVFGRHNVLNNTLRLEEAYERCTEMGGTIFTIQKSLYDGSQAAFTRAHTHATAWVTEVIDSIIDYQKEL